MSKEQYYVVRADRAGVFTGSCAPGRICNGSRNRRRERQAHRDRVYLTDRTRL